MWHLLSRRGCMPGVRWLVFADELVHKVYHQHIQVASRDPRSWEVVVPMVDVRQSAHKHKLANKPG